MVAHIRGRHNGRQWEAAHKNASVSESNVKLNPESKGKVHCKAGADVDNPRDCILSGWHKIPLPLQTILN